jgi:HSP20 family protein
MSSRTEKLFGNIKTTFKSFVEIVFFHSHTKNWLPKAYQVETKNAYLIVINLPGVDKKSIVVENDSGIITVKGERKQSSGSEKPKKEKIRDNGNFLLNFDIKENSDEPKIEVTLDKNLLLVRVPKIEKKKPDRFHIEVT